MKIHCQSVHERAKSASFSTCYDACSPGNVLTGRLPYGGMIGKNSKRLSAKLSSDYAAAFAMSGPITPGPEDGVGLLSVAERGLSGTGVRANLRQPSGHSPRGNPYLFYVSGEGSWPINDGQPQSALRGKGLNHRGTSRQEAHLSSKSRRLDHFAFRRYMEAWGDTVARTGTIT